MMKIALVLAFHFVCSSLHAQVKFLINNNPNGMTYEMCKTNHGRIFELYKDQTDSQISRLLTGIDYESSRQTPKHKLDRYYVALTDTIIKRIMIEELTKQLNAFDWKKYKSSDAKIYNQKLFNLDQVKIKLDQRVVQSLENAGDFGYQLSQHSLDEFKHRIATNLAFQMAESAYQSIGSGIATKVTAAALKSATISFGSEVLKGAVRGSILNILTMPLKGSRLPAEEVWLDLLADNPELVINPDWMREAGSQDHPWHTHCLTIHRESKRMIKVVSSFLKKDESAFTSKIIQINKMPDSLKIKKSETQMLREMTKVAVDNTYVKKHYIPAEIDLPFWAYKR